MSQHSDLTTVVVKTAIKHDWNDLQTVQHFVDILEAAGFEDSFLNPRHILETLRYMVTQRDGVYGVTHEQINNWYSKNLGGLIVSDVLFEEDGLARLLKSLH